MARTKHLLFTLEDAVAELGVVCAESQIAQRVQQLVVNRGWVVAGRDEVLAPFVGQLLGHDVLDGRLAALMSTGSLCSKLSSRRSRMSIR